MDPAERRHLYQRIVDAARGVPGVAHAGGSMWTPVDGGMRMGDSESRVTFNFVTPGWFAVRHGLRIRRDFTAHDTAEAPPVVVVNEAFVRALMPGRPPLGETIAPPRYQGREAQRTIVGIVDDAIFESQREGIHPIVYLPMAQAVQTDRTGRPNQRRCSPRCGIADAFARSVGAAVSGVDPGLTLTFHLLTDHVDASVPQERIVAMLSGLFGGLAVLIAALGLYGMTSYGVNRRFTEIGIRMALAHSGGTCSA